MKIKGKRQKAKGKRKSRIAFAVLLCLLVAGCGSKGALRAPEGAVPEPIKDLRGKAGKQGIDLTWARPTRYLDGKALSDLAGFVIFRKELSKTCPECPVPYRQRAVVNVEDQQKIMKRKQFGFVDQELEPQTVYRYRVFSKLMDDSLSDPSNEVEVAWKP
jgi:predicted small lipoprotein YifL